MHIAVSFSFSPVNPIQIAMDVISPIFCLNLSTFNETQLFLGPSLLFDGRDSFQYIIYPYRIQVNLLFN